MNQKQGLCVGLGMIFCVFAGAGMEHVRQWLFVPELADPIEAAVQTAQKVRPRVVTVRDESAVRDAEALRLRVAELEKALAKRDSVKVAPLQQEPVREERSRRPSWAARMEQMKKDNPEQYAEMQKRREEFRQNMEQREMDRADFLAAVDLKNMTTTQRENHEKLLAAVARANELMAQMESLAPRIQRFGKRWAQRWRFSMIFTVRNGAICSRRRRSRWGMMATMRPPLPNRSRRSSITRP